MTDQKAAGMAASVLLAPWLDGPAQPLHVVHRSRLALTVADGSGRVAFSVMFPGAVRLPYACAVAPRAGTGSTSSPLSVGDGVLAWSNDGHAQVRHRVTRWWTPARPRPEHHPTLQRAVDEAAVRRLTGSWRDRLGAGPGLTPYGDDVLGGALVTLHAVGHPAVATLATEVTTSDLERSTTAISAALLRAACEGWCIDELAVHLLVLERSTDPTSSERALLRVGSSSGHGLLAGVRMVLPRTAADVA